MEETESAYYEVFGERLLGIAITSGLSSARIGLERDGWNLGLNLDVNVFNKIRVACFCQKILFPVVYDETEESKVLEAWELEAWDSGIGLRYDIDFLPVIPYLGAFFLLSRFDVPSREQQEWYRGWAGEFGFDVPVNDIISLGFRAQYASYFSMEVNFPAVSNMCIVTKLRQF